MQKEEHITKIGHWQIEVDRCATEAAYLMIQPWTGSCCIPCANFQRLGQQVFPANVHELLRQLGIDYRKPAEVCHSFRTESGLHLYSGWFHVIGRILAGEDSHLRCCEDGSTQRVVTVDIAAHCRLGLSESTDLVPSVMTSHPTVQIEFETDLPWVLDAPEPDQCP